MTARTWTLAAVIYLYFSPDCIIAQSAQRSTLPRATKAGERWDGNSLKMAFRWCPAGRFTMGSPKSEPGREEDEDQVSVTLTKGFWLAETELTQGQWKAVMESQPWKDGEHKVKEGANYPATYVSWDDALKYCAELTKRERAQGRLPAGWKFDLPTEAQWEYACRASTTTIFAFGDDGSKLSQYAWWGAVSGGNTKAETYAHQAALKKPNAWGLYDMHGNVEEWCRDWYQKELPGGTDPEVDLGYNRTFRGGNWVEFAWFCRSAFRRKGAPPASRIMFLGLRPAIVPSAPEKAEPKPTPRSTVASLTSAKKAGERWNRNGLKIAFRWCPAGRFTMGSPNSEKDRAAEDQVSVTLTHGFWLAETELTQGQWKALTETSPWSGFEDIKEGANYPVTCVCWDDAVKFCAELTKRERAAGRLPNDWKYDLPTEAQWEYACRAGAATAYAFGDDASKLGEYAWFDKNGKAAGEDYAHPVALKKANAWGLHDMHGNVCEWCRDWFQYRLSGGTDPKAAVASDRVTRGGCWNGRASSCRSACRSMLAPVLSGIILGLRPAIVPVTQEKPELKSMRRSTVTPLTSAKKAGERWNRNGLKMAFRWCPAGRFTMGSPKSEPGRDECEDQVSVTLTHGFWLAETELTQAQWNTVMGTTPWHGKENVKEGANYPATYVGWRNAAVEYCSKLTKREQAAGRLPIDWKYDLPTEAQWEYACRAGAATAYGFGDDASKLSEYAWFDQNAKAAGEGYAHRVALKKPNAWGLYDMHGNVEEWCRDWFQFDLPGGSDPEGAVGGLRMIRGGDWDCSAGRCRSADRWRFIPDFGLRALGFRPAIVRRAP